MRTAKSEQGTEVSRVDVVVICALEVEFRAISDKLTLHPELTKATDLGLQHFFSLEGDLTVLVVRLPDPGAGNVISGIVASLLIARYDPWLLISFGIAGTLDAKEVKTLDVVYSQAIFYLDLRKETSEGLVLKRTVQRETPASLVNLLRTLEVEGYVRHEAVLVTGEAVVKDEKARLRVIAGSAVGDAKAVEMESFGIFQAAYVDEKLLTKTHRLCLAIKGISDSADQNKSNFPHAGASRNAADFLFRVLNVPGLPALRAESGIDQRPRPLQPFIRRPSREVMARVKDFSGIVQSVAYPNWDTSSLQAVHMRWHRPRIFYHWRLTGMGLHWVEFKFLRILGRLADAGYPVECLIGDTIISMPHQRLKEDEIPDARELTRRMVDSLLTHQHSPTVTFYSDICQMEDELHQYATRVGYWHEVRDMLSGGSLGDLHGARDPRLNLEFNEWLQYIAWQVRHEGVCILLYYYPRKIYSLLSWFSGLLPALVPTGDIKLAGKLGKSEMPGRQLYLVPPNYPVIVQWLRATSNLKALAELWGHFAGQEGLTDAGLVANRRAWARKGLEDNLPRDVESTWTERFLNLDERTPEYYKGAIATELAWLNDTFFSSFREELIHR